MEDEIYKMLACSGISREFLLDIKKTLSDSNVAPHHVSGLTDKDLAKMFQDEGPREDAKTVVLFQRNHEFFQAAREGSKSQLRRSLKIGAKVNAKDRLCNDFTALHYATSRGFRDVVEYLLEQGAEIDAIESTGSTPLMLATSNGHIDIVKLLIEKGANFNAKNNEGRTCLFYAMQHEHKTIEKLLTANGAIY